MGLHNWSSSHVQLMNSRIFWCSTICTTCDMYLASFEDYLSQLTIQTNRRNASNSCTQNISITSLPNYAQDCFVPPMIDAVYAFANALHNYLEENCNCECKCVVACWHFFVYLEIEVVHNIQHLRNLKLVTPVVRLDPSFIASIATHAVKTRLSEYELKWLLYQWSILC